MTVHTKPFPRSIVSSLVYHGTDARFEVFEHRPGKRSVSGLYEYAVSTGGFFFSPSLEEARSYGANVVAAYLDIKRPLAKPGKPTAADARRLATLLEPFIRPSAWPHTLGELVLLDGAAKEAWTWRLSALDEEPTAPRWPLKFLSQFGIDWRLLDDPRVVARLIALGYDGTAVAETEGESGYSWFVLHPDQIRFVWYEKDA